MTLSDCSSGDSRLAQTDAVAPPGKVSSPVIVRSVLFEAAAGRHAVRLAQDPTRHAHRVAADVEQRAPTQVALQADVVGVLGGEPERRLHVERLADALDELAHRRVEAVHEGFHQVPAAAFGGGGHLLGLGGVDPDRLLAEDVLSRIQRTQRPFLVEAVRERVVDGVHLVVGEKRVVRVENPHSRVWLQHLPGALGTPARHRCERAVARRHDRGQHRPACDVRGTQDPPADAPRGYMSTFNCAPSRLIDSVAASMTATFRLASPGMIASGSPHARWSARLR